MHGTYIKSSCAIRKRQEMDKSIELAKGISIENYLDWKLQRDKSKIAEMVYQRFYERYLKPYTYSNPNFKKNYKNGFAIMGSSCLMIETYMAFRKGIKNADGQVRDCFCEFLNSEVEFDVFKDERRNDDGYYLKEALPSKFYYNIRCGILHQGETNEGWTITRKKENKMFDESTLKINAYLFMKNLEKVLKRYKSELKKVGWDDEIWEYLRNKLDFVIANCQKLPS